MERITRNDLFMMVAVLLSFRSTCNRGQVGAVITRDHRIISTGYNGAPSGLDHCGDECNLSSEACHNAVHAEANAIAFAAKHGIGLEDSIIWTTHAPCRTCAQLLINSGITGVIYQSPYKNDEGLELLQKANVSIERWTANAQWDLQCLG